jgi:ABC-2 type transport system permease protein
MPAESAAANRAGYGADRRAARTVTVVTARRAVRSGAVWGLLFGLLIFNEAVTYHKNFPTTASRESFLRTIGSNAAIITLIGPPRQVDTIGGFVAWRVYFLVMVVGAIWGMLTATRLLRREEEAGRWELLLAGQTTRRAAAVRAMAGLAVGWIALWAVTAALTVAAGSGSRVGFSVSASLYYATASVVGAALFLAVGALTSQLAVTRRQANGLAAVFFALSYLVCLVAGSRGGLGWMRWLSPLGWIENLNPLTGSRPPALAPVLLLIAVLAAAAAWLAGRRDLDEAVLTRRRAASEDTVLLGGAGRLAIRLERWVSLAWAAALVAAAAVFGATSRAAAAGNVAVGSIEQQLGHFGARPVDPLAAWIGYMYVYLAALLAVAAIGQIAALRAEESEGHLENLLARPLGRPVWLLGRLGFALGFVLATGAAVGAAGWLGLAFPPGGPGFAAMLQAGLNATIPAVFVLGLGTLLFATVPRLAVPVLYCLVLWSFLVEIIGSSITGEHWLLDTALLSHLGPVPATGFDWSAAGWLVGVGALAALAGVAAFRRRDLVGS